MDTLQLHLKALGLPAPVPEFRFCPSRRWRVDYFFANSVRPLAVEIEGSVFQQGRHTRGAGFLKDCEKYNELSIMGISLLRFTPQQVEKGVAALTIQRWFMANRGMGV
jgi:hypothetical protein